MLTDSPVERFTAFLDRDVETIVYLVELSPANVTKELPDLDAFRIVRLQINNIEPTLLLELRALIEPRLGRFVERGQIGNVDRFPLTDAGKLLPQILDEHAKLRPPITDVVDALHRVAGEFQYPTYRFADNRRAEMADVHLLGDVRRIGMSDIGIHRPHGGARQPRR